MDFVPLSSLRESSGSVPVQIRVCRLWEAINTITDVLISVDMVIVDSEGTPMWVQIKGRMVEKFRHLLTVGDVYLLKNFKVVPVTCQYRPVDTRYRIFFTLLTTVRKVTISVPSIPVHVFQFPTNAQIFERTDDPTKLIDVLGLLISVGDVEAVTGGRTKRDLEILCSTPGQVRTTLWGKQAREFVSAHRLDEATGPVMIIVTSVSVRHYAGAYNFSGTGSSQIFIDLDYEPVAALRAKLAPSATPVEFLARSPGTVGTTAESMAENRVTISEILEAEWANEKPGYKMTFVGTIDEILPRFGWYYYGCTKCKSKVSLEDGTYVCPLECPVVNDSPKILYKLNFTVMDETGTLICTAMNNVVECLVDSSAKKLFNRLEAGDDTVPKPILDICGQELIFKIQLSDYNLSTGTDSFTVVDFFIPETKARKTGKTPAHGKGPAASRTATKKGKRPRTDEQTVVDLTPKKKRRVDIVYSDDDDEE